MFFNGANINQLANIKFGFEKALFLRINFYGMIQKLILLIFGIAIAISVQAQEVQKRTYHFVELKPHFGQPIIYSDSLTSTLNKSFFAGDVRWGVQTNGERNQDQFLAFPTYGIGLYHAYLSSPDTLGRPWALYFFYSAPIFRTERFTFGYEAALGVAWNFAKFDPETNSKNDLIGSAVNAYFNGGLFLKYKLTNRFDIGAAVDFTHFSNGAMQTPNKGMNLRGGNVSLAYHFTPRVKKGILAGRAELKPKDLGGIEKYNEININAAIGGKATTKEYGSGPKYFASSLIVDFNRRYSWIGKFGAGLDWIYDSSLSEDYEGEENTPHSKYMFLGLHLGHELIISKVSVVTQAGTYLIKGTPAKGWFFFRLQLKYSFTPNWSASIALKTANGFKADFIEFGIGHRFQL